MKARAGLREGAEGLLLVELAEIDELARERGAAWKDLVQRLEALRREVVVARAQGERRRSSAARKKALDHDDQGAAATAPSRDEGRASRLTGEFEAALRETDERRSVLHAELEDLRRHREAVLRQLPVPVSRAYRSLLARGRAPAIAGVANGACGGCEAALPAPVIEAVRQGGVEACGHCERLLRLEERVA